MRYKADGSGAVPARPLTIGERVRLAGDRRWWTVRAVTEHFAVLIRQAEFRSAGTSCYTVLDWRNGMRGPCDLIGQGYGDGSYSEAQCAEMLTLFEAADEPFEPGPARVVLHVSQRNRVPIRFADADVDAAIQTSGGSR